MPQKALDKINFKKIRQKAQDKTSRYGDDNLFGLHLKIGNNCLVLSTFFHLFWCLVGQFLKLERYEGVLNNRKIVVK